jgi:hypothetical protein
MSTIDKKDEELYGEVLDEVLDVGIKAALEPFVEVLDTIASEISLVKIFKAAVKAPQALSDIVLASKLKEFLYASKLTEERERELKNKFSEEDHRKLWEKVVYSINLHDEAVKSETIGKLFDNLCDDEISYDEFMNLVHATNMVNFGQLAELLDFYRLGPKEYVSNAMMFQSLGLLNEYTPLLGGIGWGSSGATTVHSPTTLGWKYIGIVYDYPESFYPGTLVGKSELIKAYTEQGIWDGHAYPLGIFGEKGAFYTELGLWLFDSQGNILCKEGIAHLFLSTPFTLDDEDEQNLVINKFPQMLGMTLSREPTGLVSYMDTLSKKRMMIYGFIVDDIPNGYAALNLQEAISKARNREEAGATLEALKSLENALASDADYLNRYTGLAHSEIS